MFGHKRNRELSVPADDLCSCFWKAFVRDEASFLLCYLPYLRSDVRVKLSSIHSPSVCDNYGVIKATFCV